MAGNIDDDLYIRHLLQGTGYPEIGKIIKQVFDNVIPQKAIDFRTNVARIISQCLQMHGVPMFRTRYAKEPFPMSAILLICYASHNGKLRGVWLKDTPAEDIAMLRSKGDGYMTMLRKYGQYAGPAPVGTVTIGGARFTGQAIVSEDVVNQLEYFVNGERAPYEEFEKAWLKEFPTQFPPTKPGYFRGKVNIFTITVPFIPWPEKDIPTLEKSLQAIEAKLKDAVADEEKAVPFYQGLKNDIERIMTLIPKDMSKENTLFSMQLVVDGIMRDEGRHRDSITKMIPVIKELRKTLELERYTGKRQVQRPLERV